MRAFKAWALQQDLSSMVAEKPSWRREDADEVPADGRGQSYLRRKLVPNPEFELRQRTATALWIGALVVAIVNQIGFLGVSMPTGPFLVSLVFTLATLTVRAVLVKTLPVQRLAALEIGIISCAMVLIAYESYFTGGATSPYLVWLVFSVFYAAYFMELRPVAGITAAAVCVALAPIVYAPSTTTTNAACAAFVLAAVTVTISITVFLSRQVSRQSELAVKQLAWADPLTGVANLRAFERFTEYLSRDPLREFSVVMVDMNGLRGANASFGFDAGDDMLVRLSRLLLEASGTNDQVARIGGDEFAVVLADDSTEAVQQWRERFKRLSVGHNDVCRLRKPRISCAVGFARAPQDATTPSDLLAAADRRMYAQKAPAVTPPHAVEMSAPAHSERVLGESQIVSIEESATTLEDGAQAAALWALVGALTIFWTTLPGADVPHLTATLAFGSICFVIAAFIFAARGTAFRPTSLRVSDFATLTMTAPALLITGGWKSPLAVGGLLVVAYYAQFYRGFRAVTRIALALALYSVAYWSAGDPTPAAETQYVMLVTAALIVALLMLANGRRVDASFATIRAAASCDALTGLLNVHAFRRDVSRVASSTHGGAAPSISRPALVIADIDRFHDINSAAGHQGGDAALRAVASRIEDAAPANARVYRIAGDEFAILAHFTSEDQVDQLAAQCREILAFTMPYGHEPELRVTASVKGALLRGDISADALFDATKRAVALDKHQQADEAETETRLLL
ncbi:MAG: diguanylate cyclase domain-containing protein [Solirubrobacterales bacterium]